LVQKREDLQSREVLTELEKTELMKISKQVKKEIRKDCRTFDRQIMEETWSGKNI